MTPMDVDDATEVWRPIPRAQQYEISDRGRTRSVSTGRLLCVSESKGGYLRVCVRMDGRPKYRLVHRLVLEAFVGPCPEGMEACHGDGNPQNNHLPNLRWDTHVANVADRAAAGRTAKGERHGMAKLTEGEAREILLLARQGRMSQRDIGAMFNVTFATVNYILKGKSWKHLEEATE